MGHRQQTLITFIRFGRKGHGGLGAVMIEVELKRLSATSGAANILLPAVALCSRLIRLTHRNGVKDQTTLASW